MHRYALFLLVLCILTCRCVLAQQTKTLTVRPIADAPSFVKRALVIGVGQYEHANPLAPETINDARLFAKMLREQFKFPDEAITLLTDAEGTPDKERPTYVHLRIAFNTLINGLTDKSEVIVYFSGHGIRSDNHDWLVPLDGDPQDVPSTCIDYDEIKNRLNTKTPARALLVVDACRNLAGGKDAGSSGFGASAGLSGPQFAEILSCQPKETSQVGKPGDFSESVFTHYLLAGLSGDAEAQENGVVTFDSLKGYVQGKVSQYVSKRYGSTQLPDGRASLGTMVLARPPQVRQAPVVAGQQSGTAATDPEHPNLIPHNDRVVAVGPPKINPADGAEMVFVPGGKYMLGDMDQHFNFSHSVILSPYYIYKNLVTVGQYEKFCRATSRKMPPEPVYNGNRFNPGWAHKDHPIVNVNWEDAQAYCRWAGVRLPTEAEWELAARGTDGRRYPWGNTFDPSSLRCSRSNFGDAGGTASVGSFPSGVSPFGALDMAGNVLQWCADYMSVDYFRKPNLVNPTGPSFGVERVVRGGDWGGVDPDAFRASERAGMGPAKRTEFCGFRCASQE